MKKIYVILAMAAIMSLSACGWTKKSLGLAKTGPDETLVQTNEPLILPPEYSVRPKNSVLQAKDEDQEDVASESGDE